MDDRDFFDTIYAGFTNTTRAADTFWMPEKAEDVEGVWHIWAVDKDQMKTWIGDMNAEEDAGFLCSLHGALPDLVRRLHAALDEADRADREHDQREQEIGRLSLENMELSERIKHLEGLQRDDRQTAIAAIAERDAANADLATAKAENSYHRPLG